MKALSFDYSQSSITKEELLLMKPQVLSAEKFLNEKTGLGADFLGWLSLPITYDKNEVKKIKECAEKIKKNSDVLLVVGIGGSYLGAKAAIDFLSHTFHNQLPKEVRLGTEILYVGNNMSSTYLKHILDIIKEKDFSINVISKSGTTTEPAIAFRILKKELEKRYGKDEAKKRIYATTDKSRGALKKLSDTENYETFVIPDDIGGRFSVLTAVGLLPIACAGLDIDELLAGAKKAYDDCNLPFEHNDCYKYAAIRNILYKKGKNIELLVNYEPRLHYLSEWWKQLYGESEGKNGKGIFPASVDFSTDLHSLGQYIQEGRRELFETVILIDEENSDIVIEKDDDNLDGLNYLAGKTLDFVNKKASAGTLIAHVDGGVPNLLITLSKATPYNLGYLFYFFEKACAVSGYILGVNPFNQPGVEAYKINMFALLGKKGYEKEKEILEKRLEDIARKTDK